MKTDRPRTSPGPAPGRPDPKPEPSTAPEMEAPSRTYPPPLPAPHNKQYVAIAHNGQVGFCEIGPHGLFAVGWFTIEQAEAFAARIHYAIHEARSQR